MHKPSKSSRPVVFLYKTQTPVAQLKLAIIPNGDLSHKWSYVCTPLRPTVCSVNMRNSYLAPELAQE